MTTAQTTNTNQSSATRSVAPTIIIGLGGTGKKYYSDYAGDFSNAITSSAFRRLVICGLILIFVMLTLTTSRWTTSWNK